MSDRPPQRFDLTVSGRTHRVEIQDGALRREIRWYVDEELVKTIKTADEKVTLKPDDPEVGLLALRFSTLGHPRRATWFEPGAEQAAKAAVGIGGIDLDPAPGSRAAAYEQKVREHPRRYAAQHTAAGVAKVVVPLLLVYLAARFAFSLPLPDVNLPHPDLPSIPWPDLPLPDVNWPDWSLPDWVRDVRDKAKYVVPVIIAFVLARGEIRRRRTQDELRAQRQQEEADES
jgi:hypothetical protein